MSSQSLTQAGSRGCLNSSLPPHIPEEENKGARNVGFSAFFEMASVSSRPVKELSDNRVSKVAQGGLNPPTKRPVKKLSENPANSTASSTSIDKERDSNATYLALIISLNKLGLFDPALRVVEKMQNPCYKRIALQETAKGLGRDKQFSRAFEIAKGIKGPEAGEAFLALAEGFKDLDRDQLDQIPTIAERIKHPFFKGLVFLGITKAWVKEKQLQKAQMITDNIQAPEEKATALLAIIKRFIDDKQFNRAFEIANTIQVSAYKKLALRAIVKGLVEGKRFDWAFEIADTIQVSKPVNYSVHFAINSSFDRACEIVMDMYEEKERVSDSNAREGALLTVAKGYIKENRLEKSLIVKKSMKDPWYIAKFNEYSKEMF